MKEIKVMKRYLKKIAIAFSLSTELSAEEKLVNLTKEQKQENLITDIKRIRSRGDYVPDYNKPAKFTEYPIQLKVITACERPVDFGNNVLDWFESIRDEHAKALVDKKTRQDKFESLINERKESVDKIMRHFTNVY